VQGLERKMVEEIELQKLRRIIDVQRAALIDISTSLEFLNKEAPDYVLEKTVVMEQLADKALAFSPY